MREKIRETLKSEVALVKPIRAKMRETVEWAKYDLNVQKNARRPFRRSLSLALAYLNGTPYAKAEEASSIAPNAGQISGLLGIPVEEIKAWIGGAEVKRKPEPMKLYIVTRADLPPGARAVQSAHAMREFAAEHPNIEKRWHESSNTLVMLEAPDEAALERILLDASEAGIPAAFFREPDLKHSVTAIALGPGARKLERVRHLPLTLSDTSASAA